MEGSATRQAYTAGPHASRESYSREEVLRFLKLTDKELRSWETQGLIESSSTFSFPQLLALQTLKQLRKNRISGPRIRRTLTALRTRLAGVEDPLRELRIYADGKDIRVEIDGRTMEPRSGQLLLDFKGPEIDKLLSFPTAGSKPADKGQKRAEAERWFERALELEHEGAPSERICEAYEKVLSVDPQSTGALVNLGTLYFHSRAFAKAEKCYRKALEFDPDYALAHFNLANLHDERGHRDAALTHYKEALRITPNYPDAHYNLALLHQNAGNGMQAVQHWKAYLKLDPSSSWAEIARRELDKLRQAAIVRGPRRPNS